MLLGANGIIIMAITYMQQKIGMHIIRRSTSINHGHIISSPARIYWIRNRNEGSYHLRFWCKGNASPEIHRLVCNHCETNHVGGFVEWPFGSVLAFTRHASTRCWPRPATRRRRSFYAKKERTKYQLSVRHARVLIIRGPRWGGDNSGPPIKLLIF